jgi:alkylation response protein AidB-like acyl-CoA dehydrogenase
MNFDFSEDAKEIRDHAREFLAERVPRGAVRAHVESGAEFDAGLWASFAEMGWLGVTVPEAHGGAALGYEVACVLAEQMGAVAAPAPFGSTIYLATEALLLFGSDEQKARWLPEICAGRSVGCFALAEGAGDPSPTRMRVSVSGGKLSGEKLPVADGAAADFAIVAARSGGGVGLFLVALDGAEREALKTVDPAHPQAALRFANASAEPLPGARDWSAIERLLDRAAVLTAFEQIGGTQAALDDAVAYAKERYAFGRSIASFQAIKHKLADIYVAIEIARSNAYYGAWALSHDAPDLPLAAASARAAASHAHFLAAKENIHVHGGMGFTWESDCHVQYGRAKALALTLGSARHWKQRLMGLLDARNGAVA